MSGTGSAAVSSLGAGLGCAFVFACGELCRACPGRFSRETPAGKGFSSDDGGLRSRNARSAGSADSRAPMRITEVGTTIVSAQFRQRTSAHLKPLIIDSFIR